MGLQRQLASRFQDITLRVGLLEMGCIYSE